VASLGESSQAMGAARPPAGELELFVTGPTTRAGIECECARAREQLGGSDARIVTFDLRSLSDPDAVTVDLLARLLLTARRSGRRIRFRHACREIQELVSLMGLADVLRLDPHSRVEPGGKPEQREQAGRVEEERDP
jgi:ABC-type transporter Mla MlaB component